MELNCKVQNYAWGNLGSQSFVAKLAKNANPDFQIDEQLPYAELWMGTHVSGPSILNMTGEDLSVYLTHHPEKIGHSVLRNFNCADGQLPFLLKILSVKNALSIQAHPDKNLAKELHIKQPAIYKDSNHKPELAIALTEFHALCGFRPCVEIRQFVRDIPQLLKIVGPTIANLVDDTDFLKQSFRAVLTCNKKLVAEQLEQLLTDLRTKSDMHQKQFLAPLLERLHADFPGDAGCLMVYFLNYVILDPFQAVYLAANEPHAYISGDCVECMACSDNVVRAGLTPKLVDVETLCSMLTYHCENAQLKYFKPTKCADTRCVIFNPPILDFSVAQICVEKCTSYTLPQRQSASILLVIDGVGNSNNIVLRGGSALFLAAEERLTLTNITQNLLMYQAMANV